MYIGLHVKYRLLLSDFNETCISSTYFRKIRNIKFNENPSSGSRVPCVRRTDGQTDATKQTVALRNFANAPKKSEKNKARGDPTTCHEGTEGE
jgi:hypothetical protein